MSKGIFAIYFWNISSLSSGMITCQCEAVYSDEVAIHKTVPNVRIKVQKLSVILDS